MGSLPPELWHHILQYVPLTTLQNLYAVNSVFFDISMDARYREVGFDRTVSVNKFLRNSETLKNPDVARRVQSLRIVPECCCEGQPGLQGFRGRFSRILSFLKRTRRTHVPNLDSNLPATNMSRYMAFMKTVQHLKNIRTLHLDLAHFCNYPSTAFLWPAVAETLEDLTISIRTMQTKAAVPPPTMKFPCLRRLRVSVMHLYMLGHDRQDDVDAFPALLTMAHFVNTLKDTLQNLSLNVSPPEELGLLCKHLHTFEHLYSVEIDLSPPLTEERFVDQVHSLKFLERHTGVIRELSLLVADRPWGPIIYGHLHFPHLRCISLPAVILQEWLDHTLTFLGAHRATLESIEVVDPIHWYERDTLLSVVNREGCSLAKLSVSLYPSERNVSLPP